MRSQKTLPIAVFLPLLLTLAACGGGSPEAAQNAGTGSPASTAAHQELDSLNQEQLEERALEEGQVTI